MVNNTSHDTLTYLFPFKEEGMFSITAAKRIEKQLNYFFPRRHLSYVFEFRVDENKNQVDFAMAFDQKEDLLFLKEHYMREANKNKVADWLTDCFKLQETDDAIKSFWIEADLNGNEANHIPSLFISLKDKDSSLSSLNHFSKVLHITPTLPRSHDLLEECYNALDDNQYVEHLGVMHSRGESKTTRLYIRGFDKDSLLSFLHQLNWPGNLLVLINQLDKFPQVSYLSIAIEFNHEWLPTIGIEFHLEKGLEYSNEFLTKLDFCSEQRSKVIQEALHPKKVKHSNSNYKRSLSHFKLNIGIEDQTEMKVYVQLIPDYLSVFGL